MSEPEVIQNAVPESIAEPAATEEAAPRPTYAPAAMALGVMMLLWGVTTMWIMSVAGLGVMICSLWIWMNEIRLES